MSLPGVPKSLLVPMGVLEGHHKVSLLPSAASLTENSSCQLTPASVREPVPGEVKSTPLALLRMTVSPLLFQAGTEP